MLVNIIIDMSTSSDSTEILPN